MQRPWNGSAADDGCGENADPDIGRSIPDTVEEKGGRIPGQGTNYRPARGFYQPENDWGPRVGFSLSPFNNDRTVIRGGFGIFYDKPQAPFSWQPDTVEVLESGNLALSSGPVFDPAGKKFATFTSIWRQDAPGVWRIVFDKGNPECDCARP